MFQFSSVQSLSCVRLFATPWIAARQASLSITNSRSSPRLTSIKSVMPSSHLILRRPLSSCPQSLPASESFPMSQFFAWGGQSTGVSALASFLPKNTQDWSPLEWTDWMCINIHKRRFIIRIGACSYWVKKLMRKPTINHFKLGKKGKVQNKFWKRSTLGFLWKEWC